MYTSRLSIVGNLMVCKNMFYFIFFLHTVHTRKSFFIGMVEWIFFYKGLFLLLGVVLGTREGRIDKYIYPKDIQFLKCFINYIDVVQDYNFYQSIFHTFHIWHPSFVHGQLSYVFKDCLNHLCSLWPSWTVWLCFFKWCARENDLPQDSHL